MMVEVEVVVVVVVGRKRFDVRVKRDVNLTCRRTQARCLREVGCGVHSLCALVVCFFGGGLANRN